MQRRGWVPMVLLLTLQTLLASYFLDNTGGANALSRAMPPVSWTLFHTWAIDPLVHFTQDFAFVQNHAYTDKAPLASWVITPFVMAGRAVGIIANKANLHALLQAITVGNILTGSLPFATTSVCIAMRAAAVGGPLHPMLLAQLVLYGTFLWAYAGVYFGHMLAGFWLLAASLTLRKDRPTAAGAFIGLALLTEYPTAIALPIWCIQCALTQRRAAIPRLIAGFAPATLLLGYYNVTLTGSPWTMTYKFVGAPQFGAMHSLYGFTWPQPDALLQLLCGPERGLLLFAPLLALALYSALQEHQRKAVRTAFMHPEVSVGCALLLVNTSYFAWTGGACFGPRHLVPACILWAYAAVATLSRPPLLRAVCWCAAFTHVMTWLDKATRAHNLQPEETPLALWRDVSIFYFNDGALPTQLGLTSPVAATLLWPVIFAASTWVLCRLFDHMRRV